MVSCLLLVALKRSEDPGIQSCRFEAPKLADNWETTACVGCVLRRITRPTSTAKTRSSRLPVNSMPRSAQTGTGVLLVGENIVVESKPGGVRFYRLLPVVAFSRPQSYVTRGKKIQLQDIEDERKVSSKEAQFANLRGP
jgi:hypothetical protein